MAWTAAAKRFDVTQWRRAADWFAMAVAAALPWSTSATLIAVVLWLVAFLPTIDKEDARTVLASRAAWLVLALVAFAALGMLWADVPFKERIKGFDSYLKLLAIPLLFMHFRRSDNAIGVLYAFLASCTALLALAMITLTAYKLHLFEFGKKPGMPVKDTLAQSAEFALAGASCVILAMQQWRAGKTAWAAGLFLLAVAFLADVSLLIDNRTGLLSVPILILVVVLKSFDRGRAAAISAAGLIAVGVAGFSSDTVRERVGRIWTEVEGYQEFNSLNSSGARLEFWKKSVDFISDAPLLGHGTGSIRSQFARVATGEGASALITDNPHSQALAVGIQLGFAGILLLYAMWIAHLLLFRGPSLAAGLGALVVVQNIFSSLFNSHLFDFTHGWLYVVGVGVAGGVMLKEFRPGTIASLSPAPDSARP